MKRIFPLLFLLMGLNSFCADPQLHNTLPADRARTQVERFIEQYPELLWLADADVRKTEEGQAAVKGSYSEQLFGQKFIEFDRTLMTLHCLHLILDGSDTAYQEFTAAQPKDLLLSRESFQSLHDNSQKLLQSGWGGLSEKQMVQAMETALVLGDMGKSEKARLVFKSFAASAPDHDDFYGEAMLVLAKNPELCPSFSTLPSPAKELLVKIANLAHYGHITHLEGGTSMYDKLRSSRVPSEDPIALSFDLFVHTCDVAGALGHMNNRSSLVYTEPTHKAMTAMADSVRLLADPQKTALDAYNDYLAVRASWLGLNSENGLDRVLSRIGAMLRLFTPEEGVLLKQAVAQLDQGNRDQVVAALDIQSSDQLSRTPTYMPAVLVNLANNPALGSSKAQRLQQAVYIGLPFISAVLQQHKQQIAKQLADPNIPLNFNPIAGIVKTNPDLLQQPFWIDHLGNVLLAN